jgi:hypothetical protein
MIYKPIQADFMLYLKIGKTNLIKIVDIVIYMPSISRREQCFKPGSKFMIP